MAKHFPVVVITGARQVGKTTLLKHVFAGHGQCVTFDPTFDVHGARRDPDLFLQNRPGPLLLDEIQYAPELVSAVKRAVDENREPGRFLLTGSQQWGMMRNLSESLAGRAVFIDLQGFELLETAATGDQRDSWLDQWLSAPTWATVRDCSVIDLPYPMIECLFRGSLPDACLLPTEVLRPYHEGYQRTYIERDVRAVGDISDYQQFGRFLRLAAALTAQEVNYSQLGRDLGLSPKTASAWLAILAGTGQWFALPPYTGNTIKRVSGKPKGYIADTGIACMGLGLSSPAAVDHHPQFGALFETAVVCELQKHCVRMPTPPSMYHWRTHGGAEVDVILERDGRLYPIEIKATSRLTRNDARGIGAFRKTYPTLDIAPGLVIAPVRDPIRLSEDTFVVPWNLSAG